MTVTSQQTVNLPTVAESPQIEGGGGGRWKCQVYSRAYVVGRGFVFTYCDQVQTRLISWCIADRWRTRRRQLRVCARHGAEFAASHGLSDGQGGRGARANGRVPSAEGPILARKTATDDEAGA